MTQRTKFKITVYIILFVIACILIGWWYFYNSAKARDYARLGDLKVIQGEMSRYLLKYNTYIIPNCQNGTLVNYCVGNQSKTSYLSNIEDPLGAKGFFYIVNSLSDTDYQISFGLETSIGGLKPGNHILAKNGVVK
jgi:hypothetical protein